jgi:predicted TIM-barrel fold metal-dependent hydrolase
MKIDCQSHVFPPAYAEVLTRSKALPRASREGDAYRVNYGDIQGFLLNLETYRIDRKLKDMDENGIDVSVISVNMPGPESLDRDIGPEGARACNDYLAEVTRAHPDRLVGLASLPWQDASAALAELDRAAGEMDLRGVMLYSRVGDTPVDAPQLDPIYARVEELNLPVVLHPTVPPWGGSLNDHSMIPMVGLMIEQSFAALRLILGGVLERHGQLKVVHPHCGGVLPYLWGRIENQTEVMKRGCENITRPVGEYYDRVFLDTVSPSALAIRFAYDFAGADRLIFGSDHPWVDIGLFVDLIEGLEVSDEEREKIWSGNARKLFRI